MRREGRADVDAGNRSRATNDEKLASVSAPQMSQYSSVALVDGSPGRQHRTLSVCKHPLRAPWWEAAKKPVLRIRY
jgi:hypothetical protein